MTTFLMFGTYSDEALKEISSNRTKKAAKIIKDLGGKVRDIYGLLGEWDLVLIVELPDIEAAVTASLKLTQMTGIGFTTMPAIPVETFDKIAKKA